MKMLQVKRYLIAIPALALLGLGLLHAPVSAELSSKPRIVFSSNRTGNSDIFIMNEDGSAVVNLTSNPANDIAPQWLGTTGRIMFTSDRSGDSEVYTMKSDGTDVINITNNSSATDFGVIVSPSGLRIYVMESFDGQMAFGRGYTIGFDGTSKHYLVPENSQYAGSEYRQGIGTWSHDGTKLVLNIAAVDGGGNLDTTNPVIYQIFEAQQDGSSIQPIITSDTGMVKALPVYSPDDTRVLFTGYGLSIPISGLYTASLSNGWATNTRLADVGDSSVSALGGIAQYSADGSKILFPGNVDSNWEAHTIDEDGSNRAQLTDFSSSYLEAYWYGSGIGNAASTNRIIITTNKDGNKEIYLMNVDGSNKVNLTNDPGDDIGGFGAVEPMDEEGSQNPNNLPPTAPHTGKLVGATIASASLLGVILVVAKDLKSKHHNWGGEK